jgi:DNA-binding NtrC family response regulator
MEIVRSAVPERGDCAVVVLCAEEELRDVLTYWFTSLPVRTVVAADGYEANKALKHIASGLIVTDRVLPPWPGLATFRDIRVANPRLRIAFVDDGSPDAAILARVTGATVVLQRPLTRQKVVEALGRPELVS